ncbi:MAG: hypothetical protein JXR69_03200 [Candidatus Delongbacteria bacterium]|nr:hypothetical protein [Candidatus Delongbacteria bacterium]
MKLKLLGFLFVMIALMGIMISCSDDDDGSTSPTVDTTSPTVWFIAPADSFEVIGGIPVTMTAGASDNVGVTKVEFYVDSIQVSVDSIPSPFEYIWGTVDKEGDHIIFLKAYDEAGNIGESLHILVTVTQTQTLTVNIPNGSEVWNQGSIHDIVWNVNTEDSLVKIELFRSSTIFQYYISGSSENDGIFSWTIPDDQLTATDYTVKITGLETTISDVSNSGFTITDSPFIQITTPNGGENWTVGTDQTIHWQDNLFEDVKIELFRASTLEATISDSTASNGSFVWSIPLTIPVGSNYKVRITSIPVGTIVDNSDASFTISAP